MAVARQMLTKPPLHLMSNFRGPPLLPARDDGSQLLPKEHCLVPCGTCDYIAPEILKAHEEALVALEMSDRDEDGSDGSLHGNQPSRRAHKKEEGYGCEVDRCYKADERGDGGTEPANE